MLLFSTEQSLPDDMINRITDFLTTELFMLDGLCKSSRNMKDKQNPNVMKVSSFEVYLRIRHHHGLKFALDLSFSNITDTDVSMLRGIHTVDLAFCQQINDVSALRDSHTVSLRGTYHITDVSALKGVHTLDLSWCYYITNVSMLGDVDTLDLTGCHNVTDFSMLGKDGQIVIR
jgi:hypothetical protein